MLKLLTAILSLALRFGLLAIELELILILYRQLRCQYRQRKRKRRPATGETGQPSPTEETDDAIPQQDLASEELSFYKTDRDQALQAERKTGSGDKIEGDMRSSAPGPSVFNLPENMFGTAERSDSGQERRPVGGLPFPAGMETEQAVEPAPSVIEAKQNQSVIRLGYERECGLNRYSSPPPDIMDKNDGELQIQKRIDSAYFVVPYGEILTEHQLHFSAIRDCFRIVTKNEDGKKYRVTAVEPAILTKENGIYKVHYVGKLSVEGM